MNQYVPPNIIKLDHWQNPSTDRGIYLRGLALDCWLNPENDRNAHYFGRELYWTGRPRSAIKQLERHIAMDRWSAEKAQSYNFMGDCYGQLSNSAKQIECYLKAFEIDGSRRESLMRLGWSYFAKPDWPKVIAYVEAALTIPWHGFYANNKAHYTNEPHELLYIAYWWAGQKEKSKEHLLKALSYQPYNRKYQSDTKFYYEYPDNLIDGWMTFLELQWLYETSKKMDSIAEIGSFRGRSTHALLSGGAKITAIDHFQGSPDTRDQTHGLPNIYEDFIKNTIGFDNLIVKKMSSAEAAKGEETYDAVFIDGDHTYEGVKADIQAWKNKAKLIIYGHDYCDAWPDVKKAVDEELGFVNVCESIWWQFRDLPVIDIIIPTLGRPNGLQRVLKSIENLNYPKDKIRTYVLNDEPRLGVPKRVKQGVEQSTGDYVCFMANDCEMMPDSLLLAVRDSVNQKKRLVAFNTGEILPDEGNINTHFIIKRDLIPLLKNGEVFLTRISHCGVDNLLHAQAKKLNEFYRSKDAIVKHYHFSTGEAVYDSVYEKGWSTMQEDRIILEEELKKLNETDPTTKN